MNPITFNYIAILVVFVVLMVGGALWYSPMLFGKKWSAITNAEMTGGNTAMAGQAVLTLISAVSLAVVVSWAHPTTIIEGGCVGFLVAAGFLATSAGGQVLFEHRPMGLFWINQGFNVVGMTVAGMILAAMPPAM